MANIPKCQTCHAQFTLKGPDPYLLPCLHSVCETCVTSTGGGVISCTPCQREVNLTETHLQKDVVRQREIFHLTVQHRPSELLCTHEDDGNQSVCWCPECEEFLCEHCQNMHESFKATRKHAVQEVGDIQPGKIDHEEYCDVHEKFILEFHDMDCNIVICARCRLGKHGDHNIQDMDVAVHSSREKLAQQQSKINAAGVSQGAMQESTNERLRRMNETSVTQRDKINHIFSTLCAKLDQRHKELRSVLDQHTEDTKADLRKKTKMFDNSYLRCKTASEYIQTTLVYSSKYDILNQMATIEETTQSCLAMAPPVKQEEPPLLLLHTRGLEKLMSSVSSFGDLLTATDFLPEENYLRDNGTQTEVGENVEQIRNEYNKQLESMEEKLSLSSSKVEELNNALMAATREKEEVKREIKETKTRESETDAEISKLKTSVMKIMEEKSGLEKMKMEQIDSLEEKLSLSSSKVEELSNALMAATREKEEAKREIEESKNRERKTDAENSQLKASVMKIMEEKSGMENINMEQLERMEEKLSMSSSKVNELSNALLVATREKEDAKRDIEEIQHSIETTESESTQLKQSLADLIMEKNNLKKLHKKSLANVRGDLTASCIKVKELQSLVDILTVQTSDAEKEIRDLQSKLNEADDRNKELQHSVTRPTLDLDDAAKQSEEKMSVVLKEWVGEVASSRIKIKDLEEQITILTEKNKTDTDPENRKRLEDAEGKVQKLQACLAKMTSEKQFESMLVKDLTKQKQETEEGTNNIQTKYNQATAERKMLQQTVKRLTEENDVIKDHKQKMFVSFTRQLEGQGIYFLLSETLTLDKSFLLHCTPLKFDREKINLKWTSINSAGLLVNKASSGKIGSTSERLKKYKGTTSTFPLSSMKCLHYWEIVTQSGSGFLSLCDEKYLIFETGLCREEDRDTDSFIPPRHHCYSLIVTFSPTHGTCFIEVWKNEKKIHDQECLLKNASLHYGILYDNIRNLIAIFDVELLKVIKILDNVVCKESLWPMFGLYAQGKADITMQLRSGNDIVMNPAKKAMILNVL